MTAREEGGNVLTKEVLDVVFDLDGRMRDLEASAFRAKSLAAQSLL